MYIMCMATWVKTCLMEKGGRERERERERERMGVPRLMHTVDAQCVKGNRKTDSFAFDATIEELMHCLNNANCQKFNHRNINPCLNNAGTHTHRQTLA